MAPKRKVSIEEFFSLLLGDITKRGMGMYVDFWKSTCFQEGDMRRKRNQQVS